jgi:hypothetical protein
MLPAPPFLSHVPSESLAPGESATAVMGINFCDSTQAANFQLWYVVALGVWAGERGGPKESLVGGHIRIW